MTHYHEINDDDNGDLTELIPFCSDSCHRDWHLRQTSDETKTYEGWNGAHEQIDYNEYCRNCGVIASCGQESCTHQQDNIVVNRFPSRDGETCPCGNWIQLPVRMVDDG